MRQYWAGIFWGPLENVDQKLQVRLLSKQVKIFSLIVRQME